MGRADVSVKTVGRGKLLLALGTGVHLAAVHSPHVGGQEVLLHQRHAGERLRAQRALEASVAALVGLAMIGEGRGAGKFLDAVATFVPVRESSRKALSKCFFFSFFKT